MTRVALLVLSTSAEATPSERTFSVAGTISKRRGGGKLKPSTLSKLTMLQRITRNSLEGKNRLNRTKRLKVIAPAPLLATTSSPSAMAATPSATVVIEAMDDLSDEFEARLQADVEHIEAMIDAGELAFMAGEHGDLELLEQNLNLEVLTSSILTSSILTSSDEARESDVVPDDDDYSLDNLFSAFSGGAALQAAGSVMSAVQASEVP